MTRENNNGHLESFHNYFESWIVNQNQHLQELVHVSREYEEQQCHQGRDWRTQTVNDTILRALVENVVQHYEDYYGKKSTWAKYHILSMFNPSWRSTMEDAFLWIGGWRPTMAFHLLYSKSGIQMEARLDEIIRGVTRGDLSELSGNQLGRVDRMQMETVKAEKEITEKFAQQQEKLADTCMVELSHNVSEMMRGRAEAQADWVTDGQFDEAMTLKKDGMVRILYMADDLRLKTLKKVIEVLSPIQGVHFLIAAAELHLRVHEWGKKMDAHSQVDEAHGHDGGGGHI